MTDKDFLKRAVELCKQSAEPMPCAVVIVQDGQVIAEAFNSQRADNQATHHAEIKALQAANRKLASRTLPNATIYCSCQPCVMCLTALNYAKVPRIVYDKTMLELFPDDAQSQIDPLALLQQLGFMPKFEQLSLDS